MPHLYQSEQTSRAAMFIGKNKRLIISYLTMRRLIGILGVSLPIIVVLGGFLQQGYAVQESISSYYYTNMRDIYSGLLCCVALFLLSYKGYKIIDDIVSTLSGVFALGMLLFPTSPDSGSIGNVGVFLINEHISRYIHLTCGALFCVSLAFNSIFIFTKHNPGTFFSKQKKQRNFIYRSCGIVMILALACIILYIAFLRNTVITKTQPILICESVALIAFGVSWLVKGNTLFRDKIFRLE